MTKTKSVIFSVLLVILGAALAITSHILMPTPGAEVSDSGFDSIFVKSLGFVPVVTIYFLIEYTIILLQIRTFGSQSNKRWLEVAIRFSFPFSFLYLVGMQEVIVESSPFSSYGLNFIIFELFVALADVIPILLFCFIAALVILRNRPANIKSSPKNAKLSIGKTLIGIAIITALYFCERMLFDFTGVLGSDIKSYPAPTLIWTFVFGVTLAVAYFILRPLFIGKNNALASNVILSIGVNWIWFNFFIVLIMANTAAQMLLRSCTDVVVLFIGAFIFEKLVFGKK